jgi:hypothetical protein
MGAGRTRRSPHRRRSEIATTSSAPRPRPTYRHRGHRRPRPRRRPWWSDRPDAIRRRQASDSRRGVCWSMSRTPRHPGLMAARGRRDRLPRHHLRAAGIQRPRPSPSASTPSGRHRGVPRPRSWHEDPPRRRRHCRRRALRASPLTATGEVLMSSPAGRRRSSPSATGDRPPVNLPAGGGEAQRTPKPPGRAHRLAPPDPPSVTSGPAEGSPRQFRVMTQATGWHRHEPAGRSRVEGAPSVQVIGVDTVTLDGEDAHDIAPLPLETRRRGETKSACAGPDPRARSTWRPATRTCWRHAICRRSTVVTEHEHVDLVAQMIRLKEPQSLMASSVPGSRRTSRSPPRQPSHIDLRSPGRHRRWK